MATIPESHKFLLTDEARTYAFLATSMKDNTPQVTPVWFNWDGTYILINTAKGRVKDRNMRSNPAVAIAIQDPRDPERYIQIRGKVVDISENKSDEHANFLSMKYNKAPWKKVPGQIRVIYRILPEHVSVGS
jgi:PPOX class probable F420-dependent enzyme